VVNYSAEKRNDAQSASLQQDHTHFILVKSEVDKWGQEIEYELLNAYFNNSKIIIYRKNNLFFSLWCYYVLIFTSKVSNSPRAPLFHQRKNPNCVGSAQWRTQYNFNACRRYYLAINKKITNCSFFRCKEGLPNNHRG
jgi:hypothetical protein